MGKRSWMRMRRRSMAAASVNGDDFPTRKLVIVGDGTCGKTSLLYAFTRDQFYDCYVPTIFETSIVDMEIKPNKITALSLWDTAGQEAYARLRPLSYTDTHVILVCFSIDNWDSFNNVRDTWYPEVRHYCPKAALILVGCKSDLASPQCVPTDSIEKLAAYIGAQGYFLCSAKTRENVTDVFETAARVAYENGKRKSKVEVFSCFAKNRR